VFFNDIGLKCHWYWAKVSVTETTEIRYCLLIIPNPVCSVQIP
jgi:hypothetical protein